MTEPIAWMASNELLFSVVKDEIYHIPLYTHPMRELTDKWLEETDEQVIANAEKRFTFLKKASEK
jgi:hypothetical protein